MSSERAWVGRLSCGHDVGSVPPPPADVDPPEDTVNADYRRKAEAAARAYGHVPAKGEAGVEYRAFVAVPGIGVLWWCEECEDGSTVVDVVENRDQPLPRLAERRAGTYSRPPVEDPTAVTWRPGCDA